MRLPSRLNPDPGLWGAHDRSEQEIADAIRQLHDLLVRRFPSRDLNCYSPIALGRHLMAACWHKDNILVPPAPDDIRELVKRSAPQHRNEIFVPDHLETIPALYEYDTRIAYLWGCRGLPYGSVAHEMGDLSGGDKVFSAWKAPLNWMHIGLLPQWSTGWTYPRIGEGYLDAREWHEARDLGWSMRALGERVRWECHGALDRWVDGIQWALRQVEYEGILDRMIRRVALWTIGSLHPTTTTRKRTGDKPPIGNPSTRYDPETRTYEWLEEVPIRGRAGIYSHPEWSTAIWARSRTRMAKMALTIPREELVAIRGDALYTTTRQPQWEGVERPAIGQLRFKWCREKEMPAPHTIRELDEIRREEDGHEGGDLRELE